MLILGDWQSFTYIFWRKVKLLTKCFCICRDSLWKRYINIILEVKFFSENKEEHGLAKDWLKIQLYTLTLYFQVIRETTLIHLILSHWMNICLNIIIHILDKLNLIVLNIVFKIGCSWLARLCMSCRQRTQMNTLLISKDVIRVLTSGKEKKKKKVFSKILFFIIVTMW